VSFLAWIIVGLVAGGLAQRVTGRQRRGCLTTLLIGVLGGLLGGLLFKLAGDEGLTGMSLRSVLVAFVGSSLLLLVTGVGRRG
jgi:uncharacterized membrane protein YeaQ/YmgE (transglycosylase-associated protein family)